MKLPAGDRLIRLLSPGPVTAVALVADAAGGLRVVKQAAIDRGVQAIAHEAAVLRALEAAGVGGVPRVIDAWDGGLALTWMAGRSLEEQREWPAADVAVRARAARQSFATLDAVHAAGVVHGDISPANVIVSDDGADVALIDFALAVLAEGGDGGAPDGTFRGTLLYVAPEVARGEPFDGRADDFALAASLLHVATGVPLRTHALGAGPASVLVNAGSLPFDASHPWRKLAFDAFPAPLAAGLLRCLEGDPRDRPRETGRAW